jgi:hypothetical protein
MKKTLSFRFLKLLLNVSWWGLIAFVAVATVCLVYICFTDPSRIKYSYLAYATNIQTDSFSATTDAGQLCELQLEEPVKMKICVPGDSPYSNVFLILGVFVLIVCVVGLLLYFLKLFKDILKTVEEGNPFALENARRVRMIGLIVIIGGFVRSLAGFFSSFLAALQFKTEGFEISANLRIDFWVILAGLSILVLAEIFRQGAEMREEQSLTI